MSVYPDFGKAWQAMTQHRFFLRYALFLPIIAVVVVGAICGGLYLREADQIESNLLDREARRTEIFAHFIERDIRSVVKDLRQLADGDGLQAYLLSGNQSDLNRAIHRATFCSELNPDYDQVRFLNEHGQEVVRINHHGLVVPPDQLQNKADRGYFQKAFALPEGQYYISAFDLNMEKGQIEQPLKPMVRVAMPVFDRKDERRGICIINYLGENMISRLEQFTPQYKQRLRILNAQGYWIKGTQVNQEWGFMYPERTGQTMAQTDPALWEQIKNQPAGQIPYGGGYFSWYRVVPRTIVTGNEADVQAGDDFLVIASEIVPVEWTAYYARLRQTFIMLGFVLLLLLGVSAWFSQSRRRALLERDRFFRLTRDMLCIASFDGYFKRINPAWSETLGYSDEELLARPFIEFVHPEDREKTIAETRTLVEGGETVLFENRYQCKDGSYRWLSWSARPLEGDQLIFATARDLTEQKRIDAQITTLHDELTRRAGELELANKELEAFSYSVSHDLRAPLRHIHGFVELLQKAPGMQGDETNLRYMNVIAKAARDMGMLIDDLLAFSRTGRAEMHLRKLDQRDLIDQTIRELEMETKDRQINWDIKPLPPVYGDPALLRLVWVNLISNAIKYTRPCEEAKIEIGSMPGGTGKSSLDQTTFYIRDNGVGFDMRYASKLFGVFQRLHRAADFEGTGIGLANVQRIIHRHGGRVWAESQVKIGSVFYFSLPNSKPAENHV